MISPIIASSQNEPPGAEGTVIGDVWAAVERVVRVAFEWKSAAEAEVGSTPMTSVNLRYSRVHLRSSRTTSILRQLLYTSARLQYRIQRSQRIRFSCLYTICITFLHILRLTRTTSTAIMESSSKHWVRTLSQLAVEQLISPCLQATEYLTDPLNAPQPSEEDGPGSSFRIQQTTVTPKSDVKRSSSSRLSKTNPYRKSLDTPPNNGVARSSSLRNPTSKTAYPSPPPSASPHQSAFNEDQTRTHRRRGSSLNAKHPGDMSHRPLDTLTAEKHRADRSRHATRKHHIQPDTIDALDDVAGAAYHHSGPYDATLFARNNSSTGPLGALVDSNAETLRATPHDKIVDSVRGHRPLDGVAAFAPGETDRDGNRYEYSESNMMLDSDAPGGAYKRWPGVQYHPEDIKGKGEPSYSVEKALKEHKLDEQYTDDPQRRGNGEEGGIEMTTHRRNVSGSGHSRNFSNGSGSGALARTGVFDDGEGQMPRRSGSLSQGLKKRWGSVKKHMHRDSE